MHHGLSEFQPVQIEDWINRATEHHERGELPEAIQACQRALSCEPENAHALFQLGLLELTRHEYRSAEQHLRAALGQWEDVPEVYANLGMALRHLGELEEADAMLAKAIALAPDYAEAYYQRAKVLRSSGALDVALEHCRRALELAPRSLSWQVDLAALLRERHDYEHALQTIQARLSADAKDARAQCELGNCLSAMGRSEEAEAAYITATQLNPRYLPALEELAEIWSAKRDWRAVRAQHDLYEALLEQGKPEETLVRLNKTLQTAQHKTCELAAKVVANLQLDDVDAASSLLQYHEFVTTSDIETPGGYDSLENFNAALASYLVERSSFQTAPRADRHLVYKQSQELLQYDDPPIAALKGAIKAAIENYKEQVVEAARCFPPGSVDDYWLQGWAVVMDGQGYKDSHFHPPSWVSGVYYVSVPSVIADASAEHAGWLELGRPPMQRYRISAEVAVMNFQPKPGRLVLFPSYMYHRTLPFESSEKRISFAFNAIPSTSQGVQGFFANRS